MNHVLKHLNDNSGKLEIAQNMMVKIYSHGLVSCGGFWEMRYW